MVAHSLYNGLMLHSTITINLGVTNSPCFTKDLSLQISLLHELSYVYHVHRDLLCVCTECAFCLIDLNDS